eukprot:scaffold25_cov342-Pavlova_lutheri.AAC.52
MVPNGGLSFQPGFRFLFKGRLRHGATTTATAAIFRHRCDRDRDLRGAGRGKEFPNHTCAWFHPEPVLVSGRRVRPREGKGKRRKFLSNVEETRSLNEDEKLARTRRRRTRGVVASDGKGMVR